jgi:hypothetical protein
MLQTQHFHNNTVVKLFSLSYVTDITFSQQFHNKTEFAEIDTLLLL